MTQTRILILGAAGRDFHNFNVVYRDDDRYQVVAFTAAQIPGMAGRIYPAALAGPLYPHGIPIYAESQLEALCREQAIDEVILAYSDLAHTEVMHIASRALAAGADFRLLGPKHTMLKATIPVIAVSAVRTGCGKSQTARWLSRLLRAKGLRVAVVRHPMPYGELARQAVQRFSRRADLAAAACSIEEREELEPHLEAGNIVYAGVDYGRILALAEKEADLLLWDGGNNDFPFYRPDLHIVLLDPLRAGDELAFHPGESVLRMADVVIIAKTNAAPEEAIRRCAENARKINPAASVLYAASVVHIEGEHDLRGARAIVVEDGPSLTHGGMAHGAGFYAARHAGARIVDPRPYAAPAIQETYARYPHIGPVLPALGYTGEQLGALQQTLNAAEADCVLAATPVDLAALFRLNKPLIRVRYEYADREEAGLASIIEPFLMRRKSAQ